MEMTALTGQRLSPPQLRLDASSASRPSELKRRSSVTVRAQGEACLVYVESFGNCAFFVSFYITAERCDKFYMLPILRHVVNSRK